ncbi:testis-expressed protein 2-like isoform X2 [Thrips palmi]|uniref:Testis-expressed protein 2-like isoform X2 n=1 Tax=Thrips palmi TaxID=161013 RepID=A0A6P8ZWN4_THRPL|nr:testis-expressed protein 2-like isoform X2 [Thrips palmi]XP_034249231.1 testis-expressed protein 2-like isoform X2 [Thrips palmi]
MDQAKSHGKPMSTSVPTFRFHAGEDEIEQIYPEIEEETVEKENTSPSKNDTLSVTPPTAPPRSPKHGRLHHKTNSGVASGDVSPVHTSLSTGSLNKRSSSMDTGIVDTPGHNSGWGLFTDIRGKISRTVEEIKSDRQRGEAPKLNQSLKENTSFSDSEEASSSESNQVPSNNLSTSDSVSQLSGVSGLSSLSTTPTTPSTMPIGQKNNQSSGKWHYKFLGERNNDEEKPKTSRPTTPVKSMEDKGAAKSSRAGSVPLVHEGSSISPQKRATSLRSRFRPKMAELRNRRKKVSVDSRSNSSLSSALYAADGDETDDDVESGVEALEEPWEDASSIPRSSSAPLGTTLSNMHQGQEQIQELSFKCILFNHKFVILLACLLGVEWTISLSSVFVHILVGILLVLSVQEEKQTLLTPGPGIAGMHMGNKPFEIPDYRSLPVLQVPAAKEIFPTDSFQGWMNELNGTYDTKSYHISMTESVHVRLDGSCLALSHTRTKVSKRAMWNEAPIRSVQFTDERIFDIRGWQVKLLPEGITRRRQWSKKYPICLIKCDECDTLNQDDLSFSGEEQNLVKKDEKDSRQTRSSSCLTTAKFAKGSNSTDSLEVLLLSAEPQKETSKSEKKSHKSGNLEDTDKSYEDNKASKGKSDPTEKDISDIDDESFCVISSDMTSQNCLYLFARADREKEEWYRRLAEAVRENEIHSLPVTPQRSNAPTPTIGGELPQLTPEEALVTMGEYMRYMQQLYLEHKMYPPRNKHHPSVKEDKKAKEKDKDKEKEKDKDREKDKEKDKDHDRDHIESMIEEEEQKAVIHGLPMSWLNAIIGRICFDLLRSPLWRGRIHQRLQKKLSTLKLPYFMEALTITELDLGNTVPVFHRASQPSLDVRGLWVELDMTYQGNFRMTIESKLNLMKLKRSTPEDNISLVSSSSSSINLPEVYPILATSEISSSRSPVFDSDLDDSAESSSDDDTSSINTEDGSHRPSANASSKKAGKKILRMVDRIANSKYFQQATEMKYIKKAMEGVSNTRIMLSVELKGLVGTLAVNLPPPPSDRLWYGFHGNPKLWLSAHPTLGERQVNFYHISNWIEQKLCQEFQKILVLPNMDDIVIPVMNPHLPV